MNESCGIQVGDLVEKAGGDWFSNGQALARVTAIEKGGFVWMDTRTNIHSDWLRVVNGPTQTRCSANLSAPPPLNDTADGLLDKASELIQNRGKQRDPEQGGERSMARAVEAFNAMTGYGLTEADGWLFMRYLKDARARGGSFNRDDYDDGIAYAALQAEAAIRDNKEDT